MSVVTAIRTSKRSLARSGWTAAALLPVLAAAILAAAPPWVMMWGLAVSIYAGLKWLSLAANPTAARASFGRAVGYLLLWPGMDAARFCNPGRSTPKPLLREWLAVLVKLLLGGTAFICAARLVTDRPVLAGWTAMTGIVVSLHFGWFHVLSLCWRLNGVDAPPIMNAPFLSTSLSAFWGKRWNLAFRDLAHALLFRPVVGRSGVTIATLAVFVVSGLVHDVVISLPARGGYGGPTLYFLIQGIGLLFERSRAANRLWPGSRFAGRILTLAVVVGPVMLLFHRPFIERVVVSMLVDLNSL